MNDDSITETLEQIEAKLEHVIELLNGLLAMDEEVEVQTSLDGSVVSVVRDDKQPL